MVTQDIPYLLPGLASAIVHLGEHALFQAALRRHDDTAGPGPRPTVSVLKPLAGVDDDLAGNLETFARLAYRGGFELLLGVASATDPAAPLARALFARHPSLRGRLVITGRARVANPKVAQLLELARVATGDVLVVSDANVRVAPDYLCRLVGQLMRPGVGLVTSLFVARGARTLGAALEGAQLAAYVAPAVILAGALTGRPVSVGKSMAMRTVDLARVGGFESVADVLAEDEVLGRRFHAAGFEVEVSLSTVENRVATGGVGRMLDRHLRWAKMRRRLDPRAFALEPLLWPAVLSFCALAAHRTLPLFVAALGSLVLQCATAWSAAHAVGAERPLRVALLEPLRAGVLLLCWLGAATSAEVEWRGHRFRLLAGTRLRKLGGRPRAAAAPAGRVTVG